ncbi:MAG: hypothetical protein J6T18_04780 [Bacteroidaceae bacterium]|nr:hypothetical protein [Bacteroidaceae bacterium]
MVSNVLTKRIKGAILDMVIWISAMIIGYLIIHAGGTLINTVKKEKTYYIDCDYLCLVCNEGVCCIDSVPVI